MVEGWRCLLQTRFLHNSLLSDPGPIIVWPMSVTKWLTDWNSSICDYWEHQDGTSILPSWSIFSSPSHHNPHYIILSKGDENLRSYFMLWDERGPVLNMFAPNLNHNAPYNSENLLVFQKVLTIVQSFNTIVRTPPNNIKNWFTRSAHMLIEDCSKVMFAIYFVHFSISTHAYQK